MSGIKTNTGPQFTPQEPPEMPESNDPFIINEDGTIDLNLNGDICINGTPYVFNTRDGLGGFFTNGGTDGNGYFNLIFPGGETGFSVKLPTGSVGTFETPNLADLYTTLATRHNGTEGITDFRGSVGIGTTNPTSKLQVAGDVTPSVTNTYDLGTTSLKWRKIYANSIEGTITGNADTASQVSTGTTTGTTTYFPTFVDSNNSTRDNEFLYTDAGISYNPSTNSLGIGTNNPGEKLQVDGNIRVGISTTSNYIAFRGTLGDGVNAFGDDQFAGLYKRWEHTYIGERIYETGTEKSELLLFKGNDPAAGTGPDRVRVLAGEFRVDTHLGFSGTFEEVGNYPSTNALIVTSTGNIGVGIENPTSKLQVAGDVTPSVTNTYDLGTTSLKWNNVHANNFVGTIIGNADSADTVKTIATETNASFFPTFVDSNNSTAAYEALYTDAGISYNPSTSLLTVPNTKFNSIKDSTGSSGSAGSILRSDGTNIFWDTTSLINPLYKGTVVRGYTLGGYQNSVAYNTVYKTIHSTDTTTNLGGILSYYNAYTAAGSSGIFAYDFNANETSPHFGSGNRINKLNMTTDLNVSLATLMNNSKTASSTMRYRFILAYIFGNTNPEKFTYSSETPTVASTSWDYRLDNLGADGAATLTQNTAYGDNIGYYAITGIGRQLNFSTESWTAWSPTPVPGNTYCKNISTFNGYIYWKYSQTEFAKYNSNNASTSQQTIITPLQQEENYHTGENKGYMVGMYNAIAPTNWQTTGGILDYVSDTFVNATTVNAPSINASASGVEYGKFQI